MKSKKTIGDLLSGKNREKIPNIAFHAMTVIMKLMDIFGKHSSKIFNTLDLKSGQTVIDYGCGPARYIKDASNSVGPSGKVIAVDIHPLAIKKVNAKINQYKLANVEAVLCKEGYHTPLANETADVIYALDMFHMVKKSKAFLLELSRLLKQNRTIIIQDGHQSRFETTQKIKNAEVLNIVQENKFHVRCKKFSC